MMRIRRTVLIAVAPVIFVLAGAAAAMDSQDMVLQRSADGKKLLFNGTAEKSLATSAVPTDSTGASLRVAGVWLVLLGLGSALFVFVRRRRKQGSTRNGGAARLNIVERLSLGAKGEVLLIKACDRLLVVGAQGNQMMLLSDLPAEEQPHLAFADTLARRMPSTPAPAPATSVRELRRAVPEAFYRPEPRATPAPAYAAPAAPAASAVHAHAHAATAALRPWPELEEAR